jgi:magnesium chelatase family protein
LLDRIDLQVVMRRAEARELAGGYRTAPTERPEGSGPVAARVQAARQRMVRRNPGGCSNGQLPSAALREVVQLEAPALDLWERALDQRKLTARGGERVLRVARTIGDLQGHTQVSPVAVAEALTYRSFDQVSDV